MSMQMLDNAVSGARAAQAALNATANNTANLETKGYSRQGVVFTAQNPSQGDPFCAGYGVAVSALQRFNDEYKNVLLRQAGSDLAGFNAQQPYFAQLEGVLNNSSTNLSEGFNAFFKTLTAASVAPNDQDRRQQVLNEAGTLVQRFGSLESQLNSQLAKLQQERTGTLERINRLSANLAELNQKVVAGRTQSLNTAGLEDERDRQLDELSSLVEVQAKERSDGSKTITLNNGLPLVDGRYAATLESGTNGGKPTLTLVMDTIRVSVTGVPLGAKLGGLDQFENTILRPMLTQLPVVAEALSKAVNDQLAKGFDANGDPGKPLFNFVSGKLSYNPLTAAQLAFSSDKTTQNGDNLTQLIDIQKKTFALGTGTMTLGEASAQGQTALAMNSKSNQEGLKTAKEVRAQAETNWKSSNGVDKDREAGNLVGYLEMYQANAKVISMCRELFASLLESIR